MNWLVYLGGGILWLQLFIGINAAYFFVFFNKGLKFKMSLHWLIAPLLVWVWICWRFIR